MGINVTTEGSGSFGNIAPGWNVNEYATPVVIGESAGGTGGVSFNAAANKETLFVVNNSVTTTEADLGTITGVITSVSQTGINASISHNTQLAAFDANLDIPALGAGGVVPALDLTSQLTKRDVLLNDTTGHFYSLTGHSQGFDKDGVPVEGWSWDDLQYELIVFGGQPQDNIIIYYQGQVGKIFAKDFFARDNEVWAETVDGDWFEDDYKVTSSRVYFKALLGDGGANSELNFLASSILQVDNDYEGAYYCTVFFDKSANVVGISGEVVIGGMSQPIYQTASLASLDVTKELGVFIEFERPSVSSGAHAWAVTVVNTDNYNVKVTAAATYTASRAKGSSWNITTANATALADKTGIRALYRAEDAGLPASGWAFAARNYVVNPSFTTDTSSWTPLTGSTLSLATGGFVGTNCLKVTPATGTSNTHVTQRINVTYADRDLFNSASVYFKNETASTVNATISIEQYDASNNLLSNTATDPYWNSDSDSESGGVWSRITTPCSLVPGVAYILFKVSAFIQGTGKSLLMDAALLTIGPTPFYAPEYFDGDTTDTADYRYSYEPSGTSLQEVSLSATNREYENPKSYTYSTLTIGGPVPAVESNAWQYLQDACSAYGEEMSIVGDNIVVRPLGQNAIDITNVTGAPTVTPSIVLGGRNVEIVCNNSTNVVNGVLYDAREDDNRVLSVNANETVTTKVSLNSSPVIIDKPSRVSTIPAGGVMDPGTYAISSSTVVIPRNLWEAYGGSLTVAVSEDDPNALDVTLVGPTTVNNIFGGSGALYTEPYKVGFIADGTEYAAFRLSGSGVTYDQETLKLQTGADPTKVFQDVATTITNPFIDTLERAYDRGVWLSNTASGPVVTLSGVIPVSALQGFGLSAGSLISYRDSIYRITNVTIGNLAVSFNATRHVTVEDFDTLWSGDDVSKFELMWSGYDASDIVIAPLRYIGDDESVLMFLDEDVNPYYDFTGEPEISVFPDTDYNPYYVEGGNLEGEDEILLDGDENPYDGGEGYGS